MEGEDEDRFKGPLKIPSGNTYKEFHHSCFKTETSNFYRVDTPHMMMKVFRNNNKYNRLANNEIQILTRLSEGRFFITGYKYHFVHNGRWFLSLEPYNLTCKDIYKMLDYNATRYGLAASICEQLLRALMFMEGKHVIHRDIKPSNVCLSNFDLDTDARLGGFEYAKISQNKLLGTIQTLHYRAPEVLLGLPYDKSIDIWSLGCTIFEIGMGHVLFHGNDELDQICRITEVLGHFPKSMVEASPRRDEFFFYLKKERRYYPKNYLNRRLPPNSRNIESLLDDDFYSARLFAAFLEKMLRFKPSQRPTPAELLDHGFIRYRSYFGI